MTTWQSRIIAALSARHELVDAWDAADEAQKQEILELLVAAQTSGVIIHTCGTVLYWNHTMERMTGIRFAEIHGRHHGYLLAEHTSRESWGHAAESDELNKFIVMMTLPFGMTPCRVTCGPILWYGQPARIALVEPLLVPEREWKKRPTLDLDLVMIGEEV